MSVSAKARRVGADCALISGPVGWPQPPKWQLGTVLLGSGRPLMKSSRAPVTSAAGSTIEGRTAIGPKECPRSNVLNKSPKFMAPAVASDLHVIHHAETKAAASAAIKVFTEHEVKHGPATACLTKDAEALLTFVDVPAEHWDHLRTSNPPLDDCMQSPAGQRVESVFATVRHPMARTKGALSQKSVKPMAFTLVRAAPKTCRRLTGANQLPRVIEAVKSTDGVANTDPAKTSAH